MFEIPFLRTSPTFDEELVIFSNFAIGQISKKIAQKFWFFRSKFGSDGIFYRRK